MAYTEIEGIARALRWLHGNPTKADRIYYKEQEIQAKEAKIERQQAELAKLKAELLAMQEAQL